MAILDPVSAFLALIDRLIGLIRERKTRQRDYFEKIIDPLYVQFVPLGEDYLKLFRVARQALEGPKRARKSRFAEVRAKREEFAAARAKLRALLERCEKNSKKQKGEELVTFLNAMLRFFTPNVLRGGGLGSLGRELVNFFELWTKGDADGEGNRLRVSDKEFEIYVAQATARLESAWYEIAGRYMELKLKYLGD
jgi:hypothetical protein